MDARHSLAGRVAVVSCGPCGTGLEISRVLGASGVHVAMVPVDEGLDVAAVVDTVSRAVLRFGGVDLCVNASVPVGSAEVGRLSFDGFDALHAVGAKATFVLTRAALPHLRRSDHAHVLTVLAPEDRDEACSAAAGSQHTMALITRGVARTERRHGVAANCLLPGDAPAPDVARAAALVLGCDPSSCTGRTHRVDAVASASVAK